MNQMIYTIRHLYFGFLSILVCVLIFPNKKSLAQSTSADTGQQLYEKGESYFRKNIDSAEYFYQLASNQFEKEENWESYIKSINALTTVSYYKQDYNLLKSRATFALTKARSYPSISHKLYSSALNNLAAFYYISGDLESALKYFHQVVNIRKQNKQSSLEIAYIYNNMGNTAIEIGDYHTAINYLEKTLAYFNDSLANNHHLIINTSNQLAWAYKNYAKTDTAEIIFQRNLNLIEKKKSSNNITIQNQLFALLSLAEIYLEKEQYTKAHEYINQALKIQESKNPFRKAKSYELLGRIYSQENNFERAEQELQKSIDIQKEASPGSWNSISRKLIARGENYQRAENFPAAIEAYQQAFELLKPESAETSFSPDELISKVQALKIIYSKAITHQQLFEKENQLPQLKAAFEDYFLAANIIRSIRTGIVDYKSKNILAEKSIPVYEGAITAAAQLFQLTDDQTYLEKAFYIAESNKALLITESITEQNALGLSGIPDSILQQERDLQLDIAFYQRKIYSARKKSSSKIEGWKNHLFESKEKLQKLLIQLEGNYPRYYALKHQTQPVQLSIIQDKLIEKDALLLEYFMGEKNCFLFCINKNKLQLFTFNQPKKIINNISRLYELLKAPPATNDQATDYITYAKQLYEQLIAPIDLNRINPKQLIIIPDYQLAYLPFEILINAKKTEKEQSPHYLLKDYTISYEYSASLLQKKTKEQTVDFDINYLGIAPTFSSVNVHAQRSCNENELFSLRCNQQEVTEIEALIGGQLIQGTAANKADFLNKCTSAKIIHLATHACIDEDIPMASKIFLHDDFLTNLEIHSLEMNAELAVLSACNTGSGKLEKGEGVISLARGFTTAGCASTVMSMWPVDDCITSDLMIDFYKNLDEGMKKNEALQMAKLNYLDQQSKIYQHPYYWAALIQTGDTSPITIRKRAGLFLPILTFGIIGLLLLLFNRTSIGQ